MSANKIAPWISEACSTIGTGNLTLIGAKKTFSTFASAFNTGDTVWYSLLDGDDREAGVATLIADGTLERTTIHSTYVAGNLNTTNPVAINLSGSSVVACTFNVEAFNELHTLITTVDGKFNAANILNLLTANPNVNVLSDELYDKLVNIEGSNFKGVFVDTTALGAAVPSPQQGDWAYVDAGTGSDVQLYIWDSTDSKWIPSSAGTITSSQVRQLLEAASDSNIFTDVDKAKLDGIEEGAEVNPSATEVKTLYESNPDTNVFTDANKAAVNALGSASTKSVGTLEQVEAKTPNVLPDANQLITLLREHGYGTKWSELAQAISYGFETMYGKDKYLVQRPLTADEVTIAPPPLAGRTYHNFDGVNYITTNINIKRDYTIKVRLSGYVYRSNYEKIIDSPGLTSIRTFLQLYKDGNSLFMGGSNIRDIRVDGEPFINDSPYPDDMLSRVIEFTVNADSTIGIIAKGRNTTVQNLLGTIQDLRVYNNQGELIHYYPLRNDAVDYLGGNLIKDEEFTWEGNWFENSSNDSFKVFNNSIVFSGGNNAGNYIEQKEAVLASVGTYRIIYDYAFTSGEAHFNVQDSGAAEDANLPATSGTKDIIIPISSTGNGKIAIIAAVNTIGTVKNFRVIKMDELSPSADFSSDVGFTTSGGVTIDTVNKQAVFGSGAGVKVLRFAHNIKDGRKYRLTLKTTDTTTGTLRPVIVNQGNAGQITSDGVYSFALTATADADRFELDTSDGWDGNVEYFSVTEVTDGVPSGTINKVYENDWSKLNQ